LPSLGIGGIYLAAQLGIAGFKPRLHDIDDSKLSEIRARGGLEVDGERAGFADLERATNDLRSAVDRADVVIVVTNAARGELRRQCRTHREW
jgi:hypothetical protein